MNLVYAPKKESAVSKVIKDMYAESFKKSQETWMNHMMYGSKDVPDLGNVTFRKAADMIKSAHADGVAADLAGDHSKDMGVTKWANKIFDDIVKPLEVATLRITRLTEKQQWLFCDDRGFKAAVHREDLQRIQELPDGHMFMNPVSRRYFHFKRHPDKLRRFVMVHDDRGAVYPVNLSYGPPEVHAPIPHRGVLNTAAGMFEEQNKLERFDAFKVPDPFFPFTIKDPNNNKEADMAAATKETTEKPIAQQPVKLGVYFRVNGLPQELTQRQANEHVAKLLTLGAATINVQRYIRDETSSSFASTPY